MLMLARVGALSEGQNDRPVASRPIGDLSGPFGARRRGRGARVASCKQREVEVQSSLSPIIVVAVDRYCGSGANGC